MESGDSLRKELELLAHVATRHGSRIVDIEREMEAHRAWQADIENSLRHTNAALGRLARAQEAAEERIEAAERRQRVYERKARLRERRLDERLNAVIAACERWLGQSGPGPAA